MKLTFLELRREPARLLDALDRSEEITISRRGKDIARIVPTRSSACKICVSDHPAFGMWAADVRAEAPAEIVKRMRRGRFHDL